MRPVPPSYPTFKALVRDNNDQTTNINYSSMTSSLLLLCLLIDSFDSSLIIPSPLFSLSLTYYLSPMVSSDIIPTFSLTLYFNVSPPPSLPSWPFLTYFLIPFTSQHFCLTQLTKPNIKEIYNSFSQGPSCWASSTKSFKKICRFF